jgi:Replication-relaxation
MSSARVRSGSPDAPLRSKAAYVQAVAERLSERDWAIVEIVNRLRLVRGDQLERLFFAELANGSRVVSRGRVLRRLVVWHVLDVLPRRIGGGKRGSAASIYAIGPAGQHALIARQMAADTRSRVRHPGTTSERMIRHTLAVSELYVGLVELARQEGVSVSSFAAEPGCWWPDGLGSHLKPDAYLMLEQAGVRDHWWIEADLGTESLPTLRRKLLAYLSFVERGQLGPGELVPRVLVITSSDHRAANVRSMLDRLPDPAAKLFADVTQRHAPAYLLRVLRE